MHTQFGPRVVPSLRYRRCVHASWVRTKYASEKLVAASKGVAVPPAQLRDDALSSTNLLSPETSCLAARLPACTCRPVLPSGDTCTFHLATIHAAHWTPQMSQPTKENWAKGPHAGDVLAVLMEGSTPFAAWASLPPLSLGLSSLPRPPPPLPPSSSPDVLMNI